MSGRAMTIGQFDCGCHEGVAMTALIVRTRERARYVRPEPDFPKREMAIATAQPPHEARSRRPRPFGKAHALHGAGRAGGDEDGTTIAKVAHRRVTGQRCPIHEAQTARRCCSRISLDIDGKTFAAQAARRDQHDTVH